ncbi:MAG: 2-hydroxyacid dehydrogenase [Clostridia bacterium]|nr:2-hydroxyacid dehydrogenase [Clostridia bacterium]
MIYMKRIAFFDTKPYDKQYFDKLNDNYEISYFEGKLNKKTAPITRGYDAVIAFVNDDIDADTINILADNGIKVLAMRCSGYSNVDLKAAKDRLTVVTVPAYSPYTVAEHTMALLLSLNRKIHKAYNRTRDFNFSLNGLTGFLLRGKTVGVIGTGKIGQAVIEVLGGFGVDILAYDPYPIDDDRIHYVDLEYLFKNSDIITLHCPLTDKSYHILDSDAFDMMKDNVVIVNTSRGALVDTEALLHALNTEKVAGAALDVYEEESDFFFEDFSGMVINDDMLSLLIAHPHVLMTAHQAFLTDDALETIARTTYNNIDEVLSGEKCKNEVMYKSREFLKK